MNASNKSLCALALLALAVVAGWTLWPRERRETSLPPSMLVVEGRRDAAMTTPREPAAPTPSVAEAAAATTSSGLDTTNTATTPPPTAPESGSHKADNTAALAAIQTAVVRYDVSALPLIDPYLLHADPEVREAARDGMVQVGDAAAARYLRAAADKVKDPREAVALLDAADYVELPAALPVKKREGAPRTTPLPPPKPHVPTETARPR